MQRVPASGRARRAAGHGHRHSCGVWGARHRQSRRSRLSRLLVIRVEEVVHLAVALLAVAANAADDAVSAPYASLRGTQLAGDLAFDGTCPGSSAYLHAGMKVTTTAAVACQYVSAEVAARVNGQYSAWHDPHNNGTYTFDFDIGPGDIKLSRVTGDKKYTDKIIITLVDDGDARQLLDLPVIQILHAGRRLNAGAPQLLRGGTSVERAGGGGQEGVQSVVAA